MNSLARKLTSTVMGLELGRWWSRRRSEIFGESSIRLGNDNPIDVVQSRNGLRSRWFRNSISSVAIAALLGGSFVYLRPALAQVPALTFELLAGGFNPDGFVSTQKGHPTSCRPRSWASRVATPAGTPIPARLSLW